MSTELPGQVSPRDALQVVRAIREAAFANERGGPHVVVSYDPETRSLTADGLYDNAAAAVAAIEADRANLPEDLSDLLFFAVPLTRVDDVLQWVGTEDAVEWEVQFRVNPSRRWEHLQSFDSEDVALARAGHFADPGFGVETRLRTRPVQIHRGAWRVVK